SEPAKSAEPPLEGSWVIDSHTFSGEKLGTRGEVEFKSTRAAFIFAGQKPYNAVIQVDRSKSPAEIDITFLDGPAQGMQRKGIFEFEDGKLMLCLHARNRPTKIDSPAGSEIILYVLKRK